MKVLDSTSENLIIQNLEAVLLYIDLPVSQIPGMRVRKLNLRTSDGCVRFHRAHFLDVLVDHLPSGVAHFGKRLASYSENAQNVELHFDDGSSSSCDVLIGCDGIKSTIRKQMYEAEAAKGKPHLLQYIEPIWSGTMVYRSLIPAERLREAVGRRHRVVDDPTIVSYVSISPSLLVK